MPAPAKAVTSDAVIYLPGIMGSELVDRNGVPVWGMSVKLLARQLAFGNVMKGLHVKPGDGITASKPVQCSIPVPLLTGLEPYTALERRLRAVTLRPEAVRPFAYDWRHSVADAAEALAPVARDHLAAWRERFDGLPKEETRGRPRPRLVLVGHSMGGLVASWFATRLRDDGGDDVRLVVTLGTPFRGAINALRILATGRYLPLNLFAESLRDATRTMPGVHELLATYRCVDLGDEDGRPSSRALTPGDLAALGADAELTQQAQETMAALAGAIAADGQGRIRSLVGTTQPTLQSVRFPSGGEAVYAETFVDTQEGRREDFDGDGTVFRSAAWPNGVSPAYLPQSHGALAKSPEGINFAADVIVERPLLPFQAGPEIGLRAPDFAVVKTPFTVEALGQVDAAPSLTCTVVDVEDNAVVAMPPFVMRDGRLVTDVIPNEPGGLRVTISGTGYSPVERLVLVAEPG